MSRGVWRAAGVFAAVAGPLVVAGAVFPDDYDIELSYGCPASHPLRVYTNPAHMNIALGAVDNRISTIATYCCDPGPASCDMNFFINYDGDDMSMDFVRAKLSECTQAQKNIIARNYVNRQKCKNTKISEPEPEPEPEPELEPELELIGFNSINPEQMPGPMPMPEPEPEPEPLNSDCSALRRKPHIGRLTIEQERKIASSCYRGSPCNVLIARPRFEHELESMGGLFYTDCDTNGPWGTVCYSTPRAGKFRASGSSVDDNGKAVYGVPITSRYFESWFANATDYSDECMLSGSDLVASVSGGLTLAGITAYSATN